MSSALRFVLGLSLAGGATCLVVYVLGLPFKKLVKKSWLFYLWLIVLLRFIVPLPLNLPYVTNGITSLTAVISAAAEPAPKPASIGTDDALAASASFDSTNTDDSIANAADPSAPVLPGFTSGVHDDSGAPIGQVLLRLLPYIWLFGASALLLWTVTAYTLTVSNLRRNRTLQTPGRVPVFESNRVTTPILVGILCPAIYLPIGFPEPELAIRHERTHLRRGDIWLKWFVQLAVCVHWFNPLAWLMKKELNRLCELACDSAVMHQLDQSARYDYGQMLLDTARVMADNSGTLVASLGKDKHLLKERIIELVGAKKATRKTVAAMSILAAIILASAVVFGALFTGCTANSRTDSVQNAPEISKVDDITPSVTDTTPDASSVQPPTPYAAASAPASPDVSAALPSGIIPYPNSAILIITNIFYDFPFAEDPAAIGTWQLVDIVDSSTSFEPENPQYTGEFYKWKLSIFKHDTLGVVATSTLPQGYKQVQGYPFLESADTCEIKEIDGVKYMFIENKSIGGSTNYIVWQKLSDTTPTYGQITTIQWPSVVTTTNPS